MDSLWRWLSPVFVVAAIFLALPGVSAATEPTLVLTEDCSRTQGGVQLYGVTFGIAGFPPNTDVAGSLDLQLINPDGSLTPAGGFSATVTTDANGSYTSYFGGAVGMPSQITLTVGSLSKSVRATCEPKPPSQTRPKLVGQCKRGGYRRFKFKNQGQCVAYVRRGPRTR